MARRSSKGRRVSRGRRQSSRGTGRATYSKRIQALARSTGALAKRASMLASQLRAAGLDAGRVDEAASDLEDAEQALERAKGNI